MSRKTPTLELLQNVDIASPVRRSSRIAQNQKSSAPVVTRRASADTKTTTTMTSETRKSRRLSLSQEPGENSESGRSTPVFTNNENKTPSTRKRKDSTSSANEEKTANHVKRTSTPLTRRSTRSMSRSPQKSEETLEPTTKCRSKHYSVTEKLKLLEAIKEMETINEVVQHKNEKENEERDDCDKEVESTSRNLDEAVVISKPIIKQSCLQNLNLNDKQFEIQGLLNKDTNVNTEDGNDIIFEENKLQNSENKENDILDTCATEKSENYAKDDLIENKIAENSFKSVVIKTVENNDCIESLKKLETTLSNGKDSTCELVLSNVSPMKNRVIHDNNSSLKGETPKSTPSKMNKTKTPEQSPVHEKSSIENKNGTLTIKDSLCEPMDIDEYTLLEDLDDNASQLLIKSPSKEPKQINENVYLTALAKNKKFMQNIDNTIKEDAGLAESAGDLDGQKEREFSQNKLICEYEATNNVPLKGENLSQDNLKIIIHQNEETPTKYSNGRISEIEIENERERNRSITQIKPVLVNEKLNKTDKVYAANDDRNYDFKDNKNEDLRELTNEEYINVNKEKENSNILNGNDDKEEKSHDVSTFKYETTTKIPHPHITVPQLNIDIQLENKVSDLINKKFNDNQEKSDSDIDVASVTDYLDDIAEEAKGEDESENNSNEIVDEGEPIGYSSADEKETDDDSFDDSFIDDDVSSELLSGEEYDLDENKIKNQRNSKIDATEEEIKSKKLQKAKGKWCRIIQVDESDESLPENAKVGATNSHSLSDSKEQGLPQQTTEITIIDDEQMVEDSSALYKLTELPPADTNKPEIFTTLQQADEIKTSPKKTKKRSSLSISENLSFDEIRERVEQVVDLFSSNVNSRSRKIYLNLSLNYESDSDSNKDENLLSTSLQTVNCSNKRKKYRKNSRNNSNTFTSNTKSKELELSVHAFQPCKVDEIIEEIAGTNKNKRSKNVDETLLSSSKKSKKKFCEESEDIKSTEKIFNDNLVILNLPKKKKVECPEENVNNKMSFEEESEIRKKNKKGNENEASNQENYKIQSELINEDATIIKKKDKKKKIKERVHVENVNTEMHEKKRKSFFGLKSDIDEVEMLADLSKKTKKQKISTQNTKTGDIEEKDKVKILSNVLITPKEKTSIQEKGKIMKKNKMDESKNTLINIYPSKSNPKLWIIDDFDTPPRPSQTRKLKLKKKNKFNECTVLAAKDFKNNRLYDFSHVNRMETTQLLKKKKKQFDIKSA